VLLLIVWIVTGVVVLAVLGSVIFGVVASLRRLGREVHGFQQDLAPLLDQAQQTAARAAAVQEARAANGR
jgi:hypothetical protein